MVSGGDFVLGVILLVDWVGVVVQPERSKVEMIRREIAPSFLIICCQDNIRKSYYS